MNEPRRIASLLSSATEMLYGLGLGDRVVAVSHECDYPADALHKPRVTVSHVDSAASSLTIDQQVQQLVREQAALYGIDVELLCRLAPDLIVTQAQCDVCAVRYEDVLSAVREHEALRDTRVVALNPQSLTDILVDIQRVGEAAGCPDAARDYVAQLQARVQTVRSKTAPLSAAQRKRVVCVEWIEPLMLAGNWMPELIAMAGGDSGLTAPAENGASRHSEYHRWEDVIDYDPDVIIVSPCGFDLPRTLIEAQTLSQVPGWRELRVRAAQVFAIDGNAYFNRAGPRIVDSLEILAHVLHPDLLERPAQTADWPVRALQFS